MLTRQAKESTRWGWYTLKMSAIFRLQPGEVERVSWMFCYSLLAVGAFILGRIIRDTLLLSLPRHQGLDKLPMLIALSALAVSLAAYAMSRYTSEKRRDKTIIFVNLLMTGILLFLYLLLCVLPDSYWPVVLQANYLFVEVMGALQVIQFWTLASELFDPRAAKRSFAIIGGGAVLANLLAFGLRPLLKLLSGAHHLLLLLCLMMLGCVAVVKRLGRQHSVLLEEVRLKKKSPPTQTNPAKTTRWESSWLYSSRHLRTIAQIVVVTFLASTLIDYQFKALVAENYKDPESIGHYFSSFYGFTGILACVLQFVFANRILRHFGIRWALLLLPIALFGGSAMLGISVLIPALWAVAFTKGSENILRYTIYEVSLNLLYVPVSTQLRARAKSFIDGILKPSSIGASAGLIALLSSMGFSSEHLSWVVLFLLGLWIVLIFRAHQEYVATLVRSMQRSHLDLEGSTLKLDSATARKAIHNVLAQGDPQQILHVLELLPHIQGHSWSSELALLLQHPNPDIQLAALAHLPKIEENFPREVLLQMLHHKDIRVRAQAIESFCALLKEDAVPSVVPYLQDASIDVRAAATLGLIRDGGLDGILHAAEHLKGMLEDPDPSLRQRSAELIGRLGVRNFYQPISRMLHDSALSVRIKAIQAAGMLLSERLIQPLFALLHERYVASHAARALAHYGPSLIPQITQKLEDPLQIDVHHHLIRILGNFPQQEALDLLQRKLAHQPTHLRLLSLRAAQRITHQAFTLRLEQATLRSQLDRCLQEFFLWTMTQKSLEQLFPEESDLQSAVEEKLTFQKEELFFLLDLLFPRQQLPLIQQKLNQQESRLRAHAIELLDNVLSQESRLRRMIIPLFEETQDLQRIAFEFFRLSPPELPTIIQTFERDQTPWMMACFLCTLSKHQPSEHRVLFERTFASQHPFLQETAALILFRTLPHYKARALFAAVPPTHTTPYLQALQDALSPSSEVHEVIMLSTFEKILFLKGVDLFQRLSNEDLGQIAQIAEEVSFEKDEQIIHEGDLGDALYIIVEGRVSVSKEGVELTLLNKKEPFGEMGILDNTPRSATIAALEDIRLLKIEQQAFHDLMEDRMEIARGVIKVLLNRLRKANKSSILSENTSS
ncbi:MAG: cyclic nucleotide-binding domain-containing protein [Myxococcales bacterium]|nr:cyclic nucleotide-binding domain-containing protein [Myxococcales bacterium]